MARPRALGYLRRDVAGIRQQWHEGRIRSLASRLGYDLCKTLVFGPDTDHPVERLRRAVDRTGAAAVFVPGTDHFDDGVPAELLHRADVIAVDTGKVHTHLGGRHRAHLLPVEDREHRGMRLGNLRPAERGPAYSTRLLNLLDTAAAIADTAGQPRTSTEHIPLALLQCPDAIGPEAIERTGLEPSIY